MRAITRYRRCRPYTTKDGATIRELMHPGTHGGGGQSLAEATVPPGVCTRLHRHLESQELYHITAGEGVITLGNQTLPVCEGDTIRIPAGMPHCIENFGDLPLTLLCCCSPAYSHEDTELLPSAHPR